jgi:hypothetical protein
MTSVASAPTPRQRFVYGLVPPVLIFGFLADVFGLWTLPGLFLGLVWGWVSARPPRRTGRRIAIYSTVGSVVLLLGTAFVISLLFAAYG